MAKQLMEVWDLLVLMVYETQGTDEKYGGGGLNNLGHSWIVLLE